MNARDVCAQHIGRLTISNFELSTGLAEAKATIEALQAKLSKYEVKHYGSSHEIPQSVKDAQTAIDGVAR